MADGKLDPGAFGASFQKFLDHMSSQASAEEPEIRRRAREHFGEDPAKLPIISETFATYAHPDLHLALQAYLAEPGRAHDVVGVASPHEMFSVKLAQLVVPESIAMRSAGLSVGPVEHVNRALDDNKVIACVQTGLYFVRRGDERSLVLVFGSRRGWNETLTLEVMAKQRDEAEGVLAEVRSAMRKRSVYRGRVISLEQQQSGSIDVKFHRLPAIDRGQIILPAGVLERVERHAVRFGELRSELAGMGRHLKRGMLLYGPPGTGKTLTAMYLAGQMPDRTVILLTGRAMGLIERSCALARMLEPAAIVLEDVDLVAEERTRQNPGCNAVLFELLNVMDGLSDDADLLFILTTNRPEILEPALASRPGRIDQAVEIPLPDATCRERLVDLYGKGLRLELGDRDGVIAKTHGVSAAFIRELLRKAALIAADQGVAPTVSDRHVDAALKELIVDGGALTKSLLGASTKS